LSAFSWGLGENPGPFLFLNLNPASSSLIEPGDEIKGNITMKDCPICGAHEPAIDIRPQFGEHLKQFRLEKAWTQEEFAHRLGIRREVLSRYERGVQDILLSTLFTWSSRLNVPVLSLIPKEKRPGG